MNLVTRSGQSKRALRFLEDRGRAPLLALASGTLLALAFPRWDGFPLAWIALVPLLFALDGQPARRRFILGWLCGMVYFAGTLWWVTISMSHYGGLHEAVSGLLMLLLAAYLSIYVGLWGWLCGAALRQDPLHSIWARRLFPPALWTALEYARAHLLTGFPWSSLGYSQHGFLPAIQVADFGSVYGVGFILVFFNAALFRCVVAWSVSRAAAWREAALAACALVLTLGYGAFRLGQPMQGASAISVAVIQGNIAQDQKWGETMQAETLEIYQRLSRASLPQKPDLVIWPESSTPVFFQTDRTYQDAALRLVQEGGFDLLLGTPAFDPAQPGVLYNRAYLLSGSRRPIQHYDKMHLVPFGEYVPLARLLFFVEKMAEGIGNFSAGQEATVLRAAGTQIGTVICFEAIFPGGVRMFVDRGARIMTTITNDAWFGDSAAADQHFSMVVFRAIENRVPFARAANTGISGFIDAHGRVLARSDLFVEAEQTQRLYPGIRRTFYTTYGDVFPAACILFCLAVFWKQRRR